MQREREPRIVADPGASLWRAKCIKALFLSELSAGRGVQIEGLTRPITHRATVHTWFNISIRCYDLNI